MMVIRGFLVQVMTWFFAVFDFYQNNSLEGFVELHLNYQDTGIMYYHPQLLNRLQRVHRLPIFEFRVLDHRIPITLMESKF
jgi:hypothetical protein